MKKLKEDSRLEQIKLSALREYSKTLKEKKKEISGLIKDCNSLIAKEKSIAKKPKSVKSISPRMPLTYGMKRHTPSRQLSAIIGEKTRPKNEIIRDVWAYIKKNNLQDAKNKRDIKCDKALLELTKKKTVSMFDLGGIISKHLNPVEEN